MPHVEIKCYPGRTESKRKCADKIAEDLVKFLDAAYRVFVAIKEIPEEEWKEKVWDVDIAPNEKYLYIKPGYTYE